MPGRALDLYRPTDTAHPFTDRAQAHSIVLIDIESTPVVGYGKLDRVAIVYQREVHAPGVAMPRYIGESFLRDAIQRLFHFERQTPLIVRNQLDDRIIAVLPLENMLAQGGDQSFFLKREGIDFLHEER